MKRNGGQSSRRPARTCVLRAACLHDHATARPEGLDLPLNLSLFAALGHRCWPASTAHRPLSHPLALPLSSSRTHAVVSFPSRLSSPRGHRLPALFSSKQRGPRSLSPITHPPRSCPCPSETLVVVAPPSSLRTATLSLIRPAPSPTTPSTYFGPLLTRRCLLPSSSPPTRPGQPSSASPSLVDLSALAARPTASLLAPFHPTPSGNLATAHLCSACPPSQARRRASSPARLPRSRRPRQRVRPFVSLCVSLSRSLGSYAWRAVAIRASRATLRHLTRFRSLVFFPMTLTILPGAPSSSSLPCRVQDTARRPCWRRSRSRPHLADAFGPRILHVDDGRGGRHRLACLARGAEADGLARPHPPVEPGPVEPARA
jgi:hypothetical protein